MAFGVTPTGFSRKTFNDLLAQIEARARALFNAPRLNVRDPKGILASIYLPLIEEIADVWALAEVIYGIPDPDRATAQALDATLALRGVRRKLPQLGTHEGLTCSFDDAVAGEITIGGIRIHPEDDDANVWINAEAVTVGSSGDYLIAFESEEAGSEKTLEADAVIEIETGPAELTAVAVPDDAIGGTDLETEQAYRARGDNALQTIGGPGADALEEAIEAVANVVSARVVESPGYVHAYVNDSGGAANDDQIAQAIWNGKAAGAVALGAASGTALDRYGAEQTVAFSRVTLIPFYVSVQVDAPLAYSETALKNAIIAAAPTRGGAPAVWSKLYAAAVGVDGIEDLLSFTIGIAPAPTGTGNLLADADEMLTLDADDIVVT